MPHFTYILYVMLMCVGRYMHTMSTAQVHTPIVDDCDEVGLLSRGAAQVAIFARGESSVMSTNNFSHLYKPRPLPKVSQPILLW